ncbi:MAG TPA: hypothetical protein DEB40_03620 [Elusimicrobia bacterium]|nr:hypothetical protein [Elusimicrobiota bacterium]HBT60815.1 hypothetical protein [Elusimicrobiota bacterium]
MSCLPAILTLLAACGWTAAGPAAPSESVVLEAPASAQLGEPVIIRAAAQVQPGTPLALDLQSSTTDSLAIAQVQAVAGDPSSPKRLFEITVIPLDLGRRDFRLFWTLGPAAAARTLTSPFVLEVLDPAGADKDQNLKDIKPPRRARLPLWPWLLLPLAGLGLWYWNMRRRTRGREFSVADGPQDDDRPPEAIAEEELSRLEASSLWSENRHKEYYGILTDIIRRYLERRYGLAATRRTTAELIRQLRRLELGRTLPALFRDLFERADLVKFAKVEPLPGWGKSDLEAARQMVRETTPRELAGAAQLQEAKP